MRLRVRLRMRLRVRLRVRLWMRLWMRLWVHLGKGIRSQPDGVGRGPAEMLLQVELGSEVGHIGMGTAGGAVAPPGGGHASLAHRASVARALGVPQAARVAEGHAAAPLWRLGSATRHALADAVELRRRAAREGQEGDAPREGMEEEEQGQTQGQSGCETKKTVKGQEHATRGGGVDRRSRGLGVGATPRRVCRG